MRNRSARKYVLRAVTDCALMSESGATPFKKQVFRWRLCFDRHARSTVGDVIPPNQISVEIEAIVAVKV